MSKNKSRINFVDPKKSDKDWKPIEMKSSPTDMIIKDYADILETLLLNSSESTTVITSGSKLRFYNGNLKRLGLRATIKIGIEKIE